MSKTSTLPVYNVTNAKRGNTLGTGLQASGAKQALRVEFDGVPASSILRTLGYGYAAEGLKLRDMVKRSTALFAAMGADTTRMSLSVFRTQCGLGAAAQRNGAKLHPHNAPVQGSRMKAVFTFPPALAARIKAAQAKAGDAPAPVSTEGKAPPSAVKLNALAGVAPKPKRAKPKPKPKPKRSKA